MKREILFLGAGRRFELVKFFLGIYSNFNSDLVYRSIESLNYGKPPVGDLIEVINGPKFESNVFNSFLVEHIKHNKTVLIISCMDLASLTVSEFDWASKGVNYWGTKSAKRYIDKSCLYQWANSIDIGTPTFTGETDEVVVKPKIGFGSRGQAVLYKNDPRLLDYLQDPNWIVQDFVDGIEVSIDCYIARNRSFTSVARERVTVMGGEVMDTTTRNLSDPEFEIVNKVVAKSDLVGPVNIQLKGVNNTLLDINPRFSGGATASILSGWIAHQWLLQEYILGEDVVFPKGYESIFVTRSRRDHVRVI